MDKIKRSFFIGFFWIVVQGGFRADENLPEKLIVKGERDAVGGGGIIKISSVELSDFADADKIDGDFLIGDFLLLKEKQHKFSYRKKTDAKVRLAVNDS